MVVYRDMNTFTLLLAFVTTTQNYQLPQGLLSALCYVESAHRTKAVNPNDGDGGSYGICQMKYSTAQFVAEKTGPINLVDPKVNIDLAGKYLKYQLVRYSNDVLKAIAAYNAGSHRKNRRGLTMNRKYVKKVLKAWGEGR